MSALTMRGTRVLEFLADRPGLVDEHPYVVARAAAAAGAYRPPRSAQAAAVAVDVREALAAAAAIRREVRRVAVADRAGAGAGE